MSHRTKPAIVAPGTAAGPPTVAKAPGAWLDRRGTPLVRLRFRPAWAYIDGIREFGRTFCATALGNPEAAERARMILQELLEDAVRGAMAGPGVELELELAVRDGGLEVAVVREADPEQRTLLEGALAWANAGPPEAAYLGALQSTATEPQARARLGLARVRHEGQAELSLRALHDGRLCLRARGTL